MQSHAFPYYLQVAHRVWLEFGELEGWERDQRAGPSCCARAEEIHQYLRPEQSRGIEPPIYKHINVSDLSNQRYNFGETEFVDKEEFKRKIQALISDLTKKGPLYLVFHDNNQDIK